MIKTILTLMMLSCSLCLATIPILWAQDTNCDEASLLPKVQKLYAEGHLHEAKNLLSLDCIARFLRSDTKIQAYYYRALICLYLNEKNDAATALHSLLKIDPEYIVDRKNSPPEFVRFYETFRVVPLFIVGIQAGINTLDVRALKAFSTDNTDQSRAQYQGRLGLQAGLQVDLHLSKWLDLIVEGQYKMAGYQSKQTLFDFVNLTFQEQQTWLEVPLRFKFNFRNLYDFTKTRSKFLDFLNPFVSIGGGRAWLLRTQGTAIRLDQVAEGSPLSIESDPIDLSTLRQKNFYFLLASTGVEYKRGRKTLRLELRYQYGLGNMVNTANRYSNQELVFKYAHVDSDFRFNNWSFQVAYLHPLYRITQKRSMQTSPKLLKVR